MSKKVKSCTGRKGKSLQNRHKDFTSHLWIPKQVSCTGAAAQPGSRTREYLMLDQFSKQQEDSIAHSEKVELFKPTWLLNRQKKKGPGSSLNLFYSGLTYCPQYVCFTVIGHVPRYSTTDQWIQESIKRIFFLWAVQGSRGCRDKNANCHKYATFEGSFFMFSGAKNIFFQTKKLNILHR